MFPQQQQPQQFGIGNDGQVMQDEQPMQDIPVHEDQIQAYGSIIKDLTEANELVKEFELKLQGMKIVNGKPVKIENPLYKLDESTATQLANMLQSIANQNTHFTSYKEAAVYDILMTFNYTVNRWLMVQGDRVPLGVRHKISFEMMCIAKASLHKAMEANILKWSKGSFGENRNTTDGGQQQQGGWTSAIPFFGKRNRG